MNVVPWISVLGLAFIWFRIGVGYEQRRQRRRDAEVIRQLRR